MKLEAGHGWAIVAGLVAFSLVLAGPGCRKKQESRPAQAPPPLEAPAPAVPEPAAEDPTPEPPQELVVATVGEVTITTQQLDDRFDRLVGGRLLDSGRLRGLRDRALDMLIDEARIDVESARLGIVVADEQVETAVQGYILEKGGAEGFSHFLQQAGLTGEEYRGNVRRALQRQALRNHLFPHEVTGDQIQKYFDRHYAPAAGGEHRAQSEPKVQVATITLKLPGAPSGAQVEEASTRLAEIRSQIQGAELTFEDAARKYSQDPYASQGGVNVWASSKVRPAELYAPAFSMKPGEIHGPFVTRQGVHLLQLLQRQDPETGVTLESKIEEIRRILDHQAIRKAEGELKKMLRQIPAKRWM
jgi:parvulin-like peptidyl-prolyl isomerase